MKNINTVGDLIVELLKKNGKRGCSYYRLHMSDSGTLSVYTMKGNGGDWWESKKNIEQSLGKKIDDDLDINWKE